MKQKIKNYEPLFFQNPKYAATSFSPLQKEALKKMEEAEARWIRFRPFLKKCFPQIEDGIIESPLKDASPLLHSSIGETLGNPAHFFLKCDHILPVAGSIKARGGIFEVLTIAEELAIRHNILSKENNYEILCSEEAKKFFNQFSIVVGSTGNLGLSIGLTSAKIGFSVFVHMSSDAKDWKKKLLRENGATVVEHQDDYSIAVKEGRKYAEEHENAFFIDDENSKTLFYGYSTAALRLKHQLEDYKVEISPSHPLYVYLPCGVGGAPGGIAFGLKALFGECVYPIFVEPTHAPCMMLGFFTGLHDGISVYDYGLDGITEADGLAVGRPSGFVGRILEKHIFGFSTVSDSSLFSYQKWIYQFLKEKLEPSATAGIKGMQDLHQTLPTEAFQNGTHILWSTGGSMMPQDIFEDFLSR